MAGKIQNTSQNINHSFTKGLNKDSDPSFVQDGMWTYARNAVNNTVEGDLGAISNETSNFLCATTGSTMPPIAIKKYIIGAIQVYSDKWLIFTAGHNSKGQPVNSEIGLLEEERCIYRPIVQDSCLGFDKRYLISGVSREKEDCTWQVYFADGLNPDRYLNIGDPQTWPSSGYTWMGTTADMNYYTNGIDKILWPGVRWKELCSDSFGVTQTTPGVWPTGSPQGCIICKDLNSLDCDKIRLARLMTTPCLKLRPGSSGGTLRNGTYFAVIAYTIKGQKVTDYFSPSNTQPLWTVNDSESSLTLTIEADFVNFDEFVLVIVQNINQGTVARQIGTYSTKTTRIELDQIKEDLITVPTEFLPIQTPVFEKSDQIAEVNNYLLRVGPTSKFDFNYQPLANLIKAKWASVEYPADYYVKGGWKGSYLRDEVYAFFIRWVYDTGDKSSSYHIPGRAPSTYTLPTSGNSVGELLLIPNDQNALAPDDQVFDVYNTASVDPGSTLVNTVLEDGGKILEVGTMGYWESTETYPDNQDFIWNASSHCWTGKQNSPSQVYDLCGLPIRHHKFPDNCLSPNTTHFKSNPNSSTQGDLLNIRIMGVYFENIITPKDNEGNEVTGVVGYEILRGSREGNKSIIAKGMINNVRTYAIKGSAARGRTGIYPNYPFNTIKPLNNIGSNGQGNYNLNDPYIRMTPTGSNTIINQTIPKDIVTFHSPDTMFRTPFLSTTELKLYGSLSGYSTQNFQDPAEHPKFKLLSDFVILPMFMVGLAEAVVSITGKRTMNTLSQQDVSAAYDTNLSTVPGVGNSPSLVAIPQLAAANAAISVYNTAVELYYNSAGGLFLDAFAVMFGGIDSSVQAIAQSTLQSTLNGIALSGTSGLGYIPSFTGTIEYPSYAYLPGLLRALGGINQFLFYFAEGANTSLDFINAMLPYEQFGMQSLAHGFYSAMTPENTKTDIVRFRTPDSFYIRDNIQEIPKYQDSTGTYYSYSINNLKRSDAVTVRTVNGKGVSTGPVFLNTDKSLVTLGSLMKAAVNSEPGILPGEKPSFTNIDIPFSLPIASHYGGLKVRLRNQYGQLQGIKQIPITPCEQKIGSADNAFISLNTGLVCPSITTTPGSVVINTVLASTPIFFGGDTFINRYTEKNTFFYFYDWLFGQPDGFEYNYYQHQMIPSPRFAVNNIRYDVGDMASGITDISAPPAQGTGALPSSFYNLDWENYHYEDDDPGDYPGLFGATRCKFYLANSSVRDFFVESDVLVDFRQQGLEEGAKHYDPYRYTNYPAMFNMNPQIITRGNEYRYDYSLSISKAFTQYFSQGSLQSRYYDPNVAKLCYTYYPDRIYYSLQQQNESFKDSWFVYLPNNYNEFKSQVSGVKSINKSGLFITFKNDSPLMYQGVDTLQTDLSTKITIGDGGLFSQPGQSVSNADKPYEYGSSQSRLAVISTPAGLFYMSENQAKIFNYSGGLKEISQTGLKWWFTLFLPYKLTDDFPDYPYQDNPVAGIGCQAMYDNTNSIIYFTKKDYKVKDEYKGLVTYVPLITFGALKGQGDYFVLDGKGKYLIGDPMIFEDASWTLSYDPKNEFWISYHDWHPDLSMPTKSYFMTSKENTIWKHNYVCDSYCNYYGQNYPFEVEIPIITGETVTTLKSVQYILECYKRDSYNCVDQFQVLDFNFDKAVVYNMEQVSGYLNLNIFPKNNITLSLEYPKPRPGIIIEPNVQPLPGFDILFSKEENKYRFNQFWDITRNRGEFPNGAGYPPQGTLVPGTTVLAGNYTQEYLWVTQSNGYIKTLNPNNMDIAKPLLQRKKFRHYLNFLNLRKDVSGDVNMILKLTSTKNQLSNR
jgi:hypothetical protein